MRGTLTSQRYVDDILRPHVGPFLNGLPGAILQQDNARPHTARVTQDLLRHFKTLPWPAAHPQREIEEGEKGEEVKWRNHGKRKIKRLRERIFGGRGYIVVKVTDSLSACHDFEPSTAEDPP
ncbi:DDE_3 domain-containing protein [Trichonephila clavipes]|uniref:DDE_3 domain-containing protein n=1 Tax=Trichonephila clavipes TaxID=2585209 RepID=A0A8X6R9U5_TRICX|nr:DDE_3 domain-containing protein [Trichonephila clavipes]